MSNFSVKDKVVIITGGAGVLGGSLAEAFAHSGSKVVILGRNQEKIDAKLQQLQDITPDVAGWSCDVMSEQQLEATSKLILEKFGTIDVLINAAGGNTPDATQVEGQSLFDLKLENIDHAIDLNLKGTIYPSLIFGKAMAESGSGSIVNVSSMATYTAISRVMGYSVGKTGVNSFTQWMATEMATKYDGNIRVNAIAPGFFIGDQNRKLLIKPDGSLTDRSQKVINKTPMGRFGKIHELNGAVQFLCSESASFITGVVLPIDGGFSSFSGV